MYISRILVKLDRNAFRFATKVGFRPIEKAEHQGTDANNHVGYIYIYI